VNQIVPVASLPGSVQGPQFTDHLIEKMATNQALVKYTGQTVAVPSKPAPKPVTQVPPLTEERVNELLAGRGLRGWFRAAR
jgi:hypothetical protein